MREEFNAARNNPRISASNHFLNPAPCVLHDAISSSLNQLFSSLNQLSPLVRCFIPSAAFETVIVDFMAPEQTRFYCLSRRVTGPFRYGTEYKLILIEARRLAIMIKDPNWSSGQNGWEWFHWCPPLTKCHISGPNEQATFRSR